MSTIRESTGCSWSPTGFSDMFQPISHTKGRDNRIAWVGVVALSWALWTARNKAPI